MSDRENDLLDEAEAVDPPDNQPGGNNAIRVDAPNELAAPVDPPENQPGGGR
jgi:hypothetical protein